MKADTLIVSNRFVEIADLPNKARKRDLSKADGPPAAFDFDQCM